MMRKIIGKILDTILPPAETVSKEEAGAGTDAPNPKTKTISLEELLGGSAPPKEPELRVIGLYLFS